MIDMPSTYMAARPSPRSRLGRPAVLRAASPTNNDDRMGSMGNTHGVSDNRTPRAKNAATVCHSAAPANASARLVSLAPSHVEKPTPAPGVAADATLQ